MNIFLLSLPSYYYFRTRYEKVYKGVFYCIKYFGFYILFFYVCCDYSLSQAILTFLIFLLFYNLYDIFSLINDHMKPTIDYAHDDLPIHRRKKIYISLRKFIPVKLLYGVIILSLVYVWFQDSFQEILVLLIMLSITFFLHNYIDGMIKGLSLFLLYVLKSGIFIIPFLQVIDREDLEIFILITALFNLSYIPKYILRKTRYLNSLNPGLHKKKFLQAIVLKNIFLFPLIFIETKILLLILFIDVITVFEYFLDSALTGKDFFFKDV